MAKRKVDLILLQKLSEERLKQVEIARRLEVSEGTISKNLKALAMAKNGDVVLRAAIKINTKKLDAMSQLQRINEAVENELKQIQVELKNTPMPARLTLQDAQIKHTAEIRKQLSLLLDIGKALYNVEEVSAFQKIVLEEIGNEAPECRNRILKRIQSRRSTSGLVGFSQPGI